MSKKIRPYPTGLAWDEALRQRRRADRAEAAASALVLVILALLGRAEKEVGQQ